MEEAPGGKSLTFIRTSGTSGRARIAYLAPICGHAAFLEEAVSIYLAYKRIAKYLQAFQKKKSPCLPAI